MVSVKTKGSKTEENCITESTAYFPIIMNIISSLIIEIKIFEKKPLTNFWNEILIMNITLKLIKLILNKFTKNYH